MLEWKQLWDAMESDYNAGGSAWFPTTEEMYWDMIGAVPPAAQRAGGFLVGEAWKDNANGEPLHAAFIETSDGFKARYMTRKQFAADRLAG